MSWAEVKKINSDMNKPLDDLLDEQISSLIGNNDLVKGNNSVKILLGNLWNSIQSKFGKFMGNYGTVRAGTLYNNNSVSVSGKGKVTMSFYFPYAVINLANDNPSFTVNRFTIAIDGRQVQLYPPLKGGASSSNTGCYYVGFFSLQLFFESSFSAAVAAPMRSGSKDSLMTYKLELLD